MAYSDKLLDHYENPRNVGAFDKGDDAIGTGARVFMRALRNLLGEARPQG